MAAAPITVEDIKEHHVKIMQLINLPLLLPVLQEESILSSEDMKRISDSKHHGTIERTGYLLHSLYKQGQTAIDAFVKCLRSTGHTDILQLLQEGLPDLPKRSPLLDILEDHLDEIESNINLISFLNTMTHSGALKVATFLDLQNPDRTVRENMERLIRSLEEQGSQGFINFMSCLRKDSSPAHERLFGILFENAKTFFRQNPRREEVDSSDRIELLQLETRVMVAGLELQRRFDQNQEQLAAVINYPTLLPYLQKQQVVSKEDTSLLDSTAPESRIKQLMQLVRSKGPGAIEKFVECLKDSTEHRSLYELLAMSSTLASAEPVEVDTRRASEKQEKLAVMVYMDTYLSLNGQYKAEEINYGDYVKEHRQRLEKYLVTLGFSVVLFNVSLMASSPEIQTKHGEEGEGGGADHIQERVRQEMEKGRAKTVTERFREEVVSKCNEGAVVFLYICGIQFPHKEVQGEHKSWEFSGAILRSGASKTSRKSAECILAKELLHWVEFLPKAFVTILIDTHQSRVHEIGKQHQIVEILEDPWEILTPRHSNTVVYFLRPDSTAMTKLHGKQEENEIGKLTKNFVEVLLSCYLRKREGISHRAFFEAVSFLWHKKGREHKFFVPAVRGDIDREFLGKDGLPYQQFFRADLKKQDNKFNLKELQIATGTMAGLIKGDQLEFFHVLRPYIRVSGHVTRAHQLDCTAEVLEDGQERLEEVLSEVYQDTSLQSGTEFLHAKKMFPLHERVAVFIEGLTSSDSETIKTYIKEKSSLLFVTSKQEDGVTVKHDRQYYIIEDQKGDVKDLVRARTVQHVKSLLEMIAWYKYVKSLTPEQKPSTFLQQCFLTAEKPLLSPAPPLCNEFNMKWSTFKSVMDSSTSYDAILQFSEPLRFWEPEPNDPSPCLEVEFKQNHVVTAVEIRGDPDNGDNFVRQADVYYQKDVAQTVVTGPSKDEVTRAVELGHEEAVRFINIVPKVWKDSFNVTFRMKRRLPSGGKKSVAHVTSLTVLHWQFHKQRQTPWKCLPSPDDQGNVTLDAAHNWFSWSGSTLDPISFDLGRGGVQLERMEFTAIGDAAPLDRFLLRLQTDWARIELNPITSVWPTKIDFPCPKVVSNFQLWPKVADKDPQTSSVKLQMQIYGNKHGEPIEVEEGDILSFHFLNFSRQKLFVYVFCLEETGNVKCVTMEEAQPGGPRGPYLLKKLLQTYVPDGYNPKLDKIKDLYKVFVSSKMMYLEPFIQRGLQHYHHSCFYNVCSFGHRLDTGSEPWHEHKFEVIVKKSARR